MGGERQLPRRGGRRKEGALLEMDGQKAMVIHPPSRERRRRCPPSAVRGKLERDTRVMQSRRGESEREKEEEERRISARPPSEERSNRCQLGEMREERGDDDGDDDDERRAAAPSAPC